MLTSQDVKAELVAEKCEEGEVEERKLYLCHFQETVSSDVIMARICLAFVFAVGGVTKPAFFQQAWEDFFFERDCINSEFIQRKSNNFK